MDIIDGIKNEMLSNIKSGREGLMILRGVSMEPTLHEGALLFVCSQADYSIGDIVVFSYMQEGYLVHRIIAMDRGAILCKGDNSKRIEVIMKRHIVGKVIRFLTE